MAISRQKTSKANSSDNSEYRIAFYSNSLLLLACGHQRLLAEGHEFSNSEEPDITGEIVRCTREYIDDAISPDWVSFYEVYDESPENTGDKKGKSRKKVDVVCTLTQRRPHLRMKFEAKRLNSNSHPAGIYLAKEGLLEFLTGSYAPESDAAGMLGYVQSDDCDYWAKQISKKLRESDIQLQQSGFEGIDNSYTSVHNRPTIKKEITIYHFLLDFTFVRNN